MSRKIRAVSLGLQFPVALAILTLALLAEGVGLLNVAWIDRIPRWCRGLGRWAFNVLHRIDALSQE